MKRTVVVISNMENNTYFFSTNHCQNHGLGDNYIPCSHTIPSYCEPRNSVPNGKIETIEDLVSVFYDDMEEIDNPNPKFKPETIKSFN